jgi:hypothetical protein
MPHQGIGHSKGVLRRLHQAFFLETIDGANLLEAVEAHFCITFRPARSSDVPLVFRNILNFV